MKKYLTLLILLSQLTLATFAQSYFTLENDNIQAVFNLNNGALVQFKDKKTSWNIISENKFGRSFEMMVLLKSGQRTTIHGTDQAKPELKRSGNRITFIWKTLRLSPQDKLPAKIQFSGSVSLTENGLEYDGEVANRSECVVENLCWPVIGDFVNPGKSDPLLFQYITYSRLETETLFPHPKSYTGWCNLPEAAFGLFHNNKQGLYVSSKDAKLNEYIQFMYEMLPLDNYGALAGTVPTTIADNERICLRTQLKAKRVIYTQPDSLSRLVSVVLQPYSGSWHAGADIYKKWRATWYKPPYRPEWIRNVNSWQQLQINSSEDFRSFQYKDLVDYARECKQLGVNAIQLTGWHLGGQDRGVPGHSTDPRLGTEEELKAAITASQRLGVKILLFTKFTWIDLTSDLYEDYKDHIAKDVAGNPCLHPGYNYNTYTQLLGINTRRFGVLCLEDTACRRLLCNEFQKCLDLGAAGMVYDENQHHAGHQLCFDPSHGHRIPGFLYRGADLLGSDFMRITQKFHYNFLMAGEGCYDLQSKYYATYTRADVHHIPVLRYIDPELPIACAVIDHFDKNRINMCLKNRYAISYEPRSFKGLLSEIPRLVNYGRQVDRLREKYKDRLWFAVYKDTLGASVAGNHISYSVFERRRDGKKAVVILNTDLNEPSVATIAIDESLRNLLVVSPENPDPVPLLKREITLQPQSAVVVWEE